MDSNLTLNVTNTADQVSQVLELRVTLAICCLGTVLNLLNLLVLTEPGLRAAPYVYLRALAGTDLAALALTLLFLVLTGPPGPQGYITSDGTAAGDFGVLYGAHFFYPVTSICHNASLWMVVTLTIDRLVIVRRFIVGGSGWTRDPCSAAAAKVITGVVFVIITLLNIPRFMAYEMFKIIKDFLVKVSKRHEGLTLIPTHFRYSKVNERILLAYLLLFGVVPLTSLVVLSLLLIYYFKRAKKPRVMLRNTKKSEAQSTRFTSTTLAIAGCSFLFVLPAAMGDGLMMSAILGHSRNFKQFLISPSFKVYRTVSNMLLIFNVSCHFILLSFFNKKYTKVREQMFSRWKRSWPLR